MPILFHNVGTIEACVPRMKCKLIIEGKGKTIKVVWSTKVQFFWAQIQRYLWNKYKHIFWNKSYKSCLVDQSPIVPVFIFCLRGCSSEFLSPIVASPASFGENHDYPRKLNWKECFKLADFPAVWYLSVEKGNQLVLNRTWNVCCYMFCYMLCYVWICVFLAFTVDLL